VKLLKKGKVKVGNQGSKN